MRLFSYCNFISADWIECYVFSIYQICFCVKYTNKLSTPINVYFVRIPRLMLDVFCGTKCLQR